jgi:CheY-like chemotaxis protein
MQWMRNLKVNGKLLVMVLIPMLGVIGFSISSVYDKVTNVMEMNRLQTLTSITVSINDLIHELQTERSLAAGLYGKKSSVIQTSYTEQKTNTDKKAAELNNSLTHIQVSDYDAKFAGDLTASLTMLNKLSEQRNLIDSARIGENAALSYYSDVVLSFFEVMNNLNELSSGTQVSSMNSAYINFSRSKIAASQERSTLYNVFYQNQAEPAEIQSIILTDNESKLYYRVFASFATPQALEAYRTTVRGQSLSEVDRMRQLVLDAGPGKPLGVDPEYWFNMSTDKIDLLKLTEQKLTDELISTMLQVRDRATFSLVAVIVLNVLIILASLICILIVSRLMLGQIRDLKKSTELILLGETEVETEVKSKDEFGMLTEAFNLMAASSREVIGHADRVSRGDYNQQIVPRSSQDKLSFALNKMVVSLKETKAENERQFWLKTQLARLTGLSQGVTNLKQLASLLISEIAGLVEAGQGVIYVKNHSKSAENQEEFLLLGSYAYKERKHLTTRIKPGEGLVGQCVLEKKPIILTQVPDDYVQITSGLGERKPLTIIVLPVLFEDDAIAVIELASFQRLTAVQNDLLEQLSSNMGVVMNSVISRQLTEELLKESQELAEELQTQQEELRTANEELEEQTFMLRQSEEKLKVQSEELQAINEELEEKTNYLETQKEDIEKQNRLIQISKQELELKAQELEQASRYKSDFLANMSHELRTPLNSLLILAKSLANNDDGNLNEEQIESAKVIYSGGLDLLTLINDILDLSKVEAGKLGIHTEEVKLASIVNNLQYQFNPVAKDKKLAFFIQIEEGAPESIVTDAQRTEQIVKNLLSNAFKFTSTGKITLRVYRPDKGMPMYGARLSAADAVALEVIDTGIGIPQAKQKDIFEAFQQADGSTSRKYGGTGLGLTISRQLAKLLGGEMHMSSTEGVGSTFTLLLPLRAADAMEQESGGGAPHILENSRYASAVPSLHSVQPFAGEPLVAAGAAADVPLEPFPVKSYIPDDRTDVTPESKDRVILIIEDDKSFAKVLLDMSRKKGFKCLVAGDGFNGLQLAKQYIPSAVMLDLGLPDMDGLKVLDHLKFHNETRHIPVHIVSGRDAVNASLKKGAIGYLTKPVRTEDIESMFARIEGKWDEGIKHVLVVEDDRSNQTAIRELLKHKNIEIHSAFTGEEGLEKIAGQTYDCVILDLKLPDMSGFDMLRKLVANKDISTPPIIVNTGKELNQDEYRELNRFTDSIVIKGANSPERLLDEVSLFLHSVQKSLPPEQREMIRMVHESDETLKGRKILLVDDDLRNTFALSKVLRQRGLEVVMADNGKLALEKLDSEQGIELVIMDIMMPVMDGYEAMQRIRAHELHSKLPIIALTAKAMAGDREKCIEGGANDYMTKPVDTDKLLSLIRVWLSQ